MSRGGRRKEESSQRGRTMKGAKTGVCPTRVGRVEYTVRGTEREVQKKVVGRTASLCLLKKSRNIELNRETMKGEKVRIKVREHPITGKSPTKDRTTLAHG